MIEKRSKWGASEPDAGFGFKPLTRPVNIRWGVARGCGNFLGGAGLLESRSPPRDIADLWQPGQFLR